MSIVKGEIEVIDEGGRDEESSCPPDLKEVRGMVCARCQIELVRARVCPDCGTLLCGSCIEDHGLACIEGALDVPLD